MLKNYRFILFLILILIICSINGWAKTFVGTIITYDGDEYHSVAYKIDKLHKRVTFDHEGEKVKITFYKIRAIFNTEGKIVFHDDIKRYYDLSWETWRYMDGKELFKNLTKSWHVGIRLGVNYSKPTGDYYKKIDPGVGFDGDLFIAASNKSEFRLMFSKSGMKVSETFRKPLISLDPNVEIRSQEYTIDAYRFVLAFQFHSQFTNIKRWDMKSFAYIGLGAIYHRFRLRATLWDSSTNRSYDLNEYSNETDFITNFGFGYMIFLSKDFGFDLGGCGDLVFTESGSDGKRQFAFVIDAKIGIIAFL